MPELGWYLIWPLLGGVGLMLILGAQPLGVPRPTLQEWLDRMDVRAREAQRVARETQPRSTVGAPWPAVNRVLGPLLSDAASLLRRLQNHLGLGSGTDPMRDIRRVEPDMTEGRWLARRLAVAAILGLALPTFVVILRAAGLPETLLSRVPVWAWLALAALGYIAPAWEVDRKLAARRRRLRAALPALLQTLAIGASAGMSLQACFRYVVTRGGSGPFAAAIREMLDSLDAGEYVSLQQALPALSVSCDIAEVERLVQRLKGNVEAGAGFQVAVHELVLVTRADDQAQLRRVGVERAVRMLVPVVVFLLIPLLIVFLYPLIVLVKSL
jgi:pilus assembly protein TadC